MFRRDCTYKSHLKSIGCGNLFKQLAEFIPEYIYRQ